MNWQDRNGQNRNGQDRDWLDEEPLADRSFAATFLRWPLALFYGGTGIGHLVAPQAFLAIMPPFVPAPLAVIVFTGLCEIAGAIGLFIPRLRWWAAVGLAAYAVCVFPANLYHAFAGIMVPGLPSSWWYHGPRLAFQPVLVWWAWACRK
jgi:uncharacterized membrane protein